MPDIEQHLVTRFKSHKDALKELERFVRIPKNLQSGKRFKQLGGMLPREAWANLLICLAVNSTVAEPERLTFSSDPTGGDGIICDKVTGETWRTEHVIVPEVFGTAAADSETLILNAIQHKHSRGADYAEGKTLVVFQTALGQPWKPTVIAKKLPSGLNFTAVWVVGFQAVEAGEYVYNVTRLDLTHGQAPVWRVRIGKDFDSWKVDPVQ